MKLHISHETVYDYEQPIRNLVQSLRLTPSVSESQRTHDWQIVVEDGLKGPGFRDGAGDWIEGWTLRGPLRQVTVRINGHVETRDTAGVLRGHRELINPLAYLRDTPATLPDKNIRKLANSVESPDDFLGLAHKLSEAVGKAVEFRPGATEINTTAAQALKIGAGVCQDHSQVLIAVARCRELPARYVSGYLHSTADGSSHEAAHAWAEIYVTGLGWIGFDPANNTCPDERYVRLGSGLDAVDAAPIRGVSNGSGVEKMAVKVQVEEVQPDQ